MFYIIILAFISEREMEKKLLVIPGYLVGCGGLALITYRTVLALSTQSKAITVQVNRFGEQYVDLVVLGFLWVVCLVGMWSLSQLVKEPGLKAEHSHAQSVALQDHGSSFFNENGANVPQVSLGSSPGDVLGYVSVDESCLSTASVSVTVVSETFSE
jgi:hypothetical protein